MGPKWSYLDSESIGGGRLGNPGVEVPVVPSVDVELGVVW